jgi:hypothetical protein
LGLIRNVIASLRNDICANYHTAEAPLNPLMLLPKITPVKETCLYSDKKVSEDLFIANSQDTAYVIKQ